VLSCSPAQSSAVSKQQQPKQRSSKKRQQQDASEQLPPSKKRKASSSLPTAVSKQLHAVADLIMPRHKTGAFQEVLGNVAAWRDVVVMRVYRWCQENDFKAITREHLSTQLTK
jgi:hypothetical protein